MNKNLIKKLSLLFFLIIGSTFIYLRMTEKSEEPPKQQIPKEITKKISNDQKAILSNVIREENQKGESFEDFSSIDFDPAVFLKNPEVLAKGGRKFLEESYLDLKKCYRQGCGQTPDEEDGFYDPALTVSMISMKRILEVALLAPEKLEADEWLTVDELKEMLNVENEEVRKLALKNLMGLHKSNPQVFNEALRANDQLSGEKAADLMGELMNYVDDQNKAAFLESLEMIAKEKNAYTANKVLRKTQDLKVDKDQIERIGSELCRFKADTFNFNGLNYSLKNMATNSGHQFTLKNYCR